MIPEPYFIYDQRKPRKRKTKSGRIKKPKCRISIKQNHPTGKIQIAFKPPQYLNLAKGWNNKTGLPNDVYQAGDLQNLLTALKDIAERAKIKTGSYPNLRECYKKFLNPSNKKGLPESNSLIEWAQWRADQLGKPRGQGYLNLIQHLQDWGRNDTDLVDLDEDWLIEYAKYLKSRPRKNREKADEPLLRKSTIQKQISLLRQLIKAIRKANKKILIGELPNIKVQGEEPAQRMPLDFGELMRLLNLDKLNPFLTVVRDHFLLMCFTGVRISDLNNSWQIYPDRIVHRQKKTEAMHAITLNQYSRQLIEKYSVLNMDGSRTMTLEEKTPQYMNRCLIKLAKLAHISKHVHCHIGRHSYARLLRDIGVGEDVRAKELGHTRGSVTQQYGLIDSDFQIRVVQERWRRALSLWREDQSYQDWYFKVNTV